MVKGNTLTVSATRAPVTVIIAFIICITKLLHSDWLRGVQSILLIVLQYNLSINDFPKTNKMVERFLNTNEFTLDELKGKAVNAKTAQKCG